MLSFQPIIPENLPIMLECLKVLHVQKWYTVENLAKKKEYGEYMYVWGRD